MTDLAGRVSLHESMAGKAEITLEIRLPGAVPAVAAGLLGSGSCSDGTLGWLQRGDPAPGSRGADAEAVTDSIRPMNEHAPAIGRGVLVYPSHFTDFVPFAPTVTIGF